MSASPPDSSPRLSPPGKSGCLEQFLRLALVGLVLVLGGSCLFAPVNFLRRKALMTVSLGNMRELYLATDMMAADGLRSSNPAFGWPGDTGGSFTNTVGHLIQGGYLTTNDFRKIIHAEERPGREFPVANTNGILIYGVGASSPGRTVFLSSWNFTNTPTGGLLGSQPAAPFGWNGFAVLHRDGSGQILPASAAGHADRVGAYAPLLQ